MLSTLTQYLYDFSQQVPLPVFTAVGSLIEEIISPIPSQAIMIFGGSLARAAHTGQLMLVLMALTGAVGKTLGSLLYYVFADKIEDIIVPRFGKYIGISHEQLEQVGKKLGRGWADDIALFLLRLIPAVPSSPVSVACGLIKIDLRTFIVTAFFGSFFRNWMYLLIGFYGWEAYRRFLQPFLPYQKYIIPSLVLVGVGLAILGYRYWRRKKRDSLAAGSV